MYQMIIVDDEPQIRKGLMNLVPWDEFGIEIVGEASDGAQALELLRNAQPQLAIVDIRMPCMDGLALIEAAGKLKSPPKFIVLSGFDQFDYVRASMRLGVSNYLLKPVDPDELAATIQSVTAALDDEAAKKQQFDESMKALLNNTLNRLLCNRIEVRELREKCQLLDITLRCNQMAVGIVRPLFDNTDVTLRYIMFRSLDLCRALLSRALTAYPVADNEDNVAVILKNEDRKYTSDELLALLQQCADRISRELGVSCLVALGGWACSFKELPASYQGALRMLDIKTVWADAEVNPTVLTSVQQTVVSVFDADTLADQFLQGQEEQLMQTVRDFFYKTLPESRVSDPVLVRCHLVELVICILQAARKCYVPEAELAQLKHTCYENIRSAQSIHTLEQHLCRMIRQLCSSIRQMDSCTYSPKVQMAVRYIRQHYDDGNLSLKTLAGQLDVNSAYLGRQFSLETGAFFSDFLNNVRIQHAKRLLNTTPLKISEIAARVGFMNISYFYTIYKKITGERPGSVRRQDSAAERGGSQ